MSISGRVCTGVGGVSSYLESTPAALAARSDAAGMPLYPGTLNVRVADVGAAIASFGEPAFLTDRDNAKLGPLQWWSVAIGRGNEWAAGFVVRHERSSADYVEVMAQTRLRDLGWQDGDSVTVRCVGCKDAESVLAVARAVSHRWWAPFGWLPASARPGRPLADSDEIWGHMDAADFRGASVLDFGCHEGYHTFRALHAGARLGVGVDKTPRVVTVARAINAFIERSAAEFRVADTLDGLPESDVVMSLSVWHQVDPTYERLGEHIADLVALARRCVYLDLITPPLKGRRDADAVVLEAGGRKLWHRKHPVRRHRTLYRIPASDG